MKTLNERIQDLRNILVTCYNAIERKGGTIPEAGLRNMSNLPDAVASIPQTHGVLTELEVTANGEYLPEEGADGFSKVTAKFDTSSLPKVKVKSFLVNDDCINEDGYWNAELIDTSTTSSFRELFWNCSNLRSLDVSSWDTSNVTTMERLFQGCSSLQELNTKDWDVSNVTTMVYAFYGCSQLKTLDVSNWDMKNVISAGGMFSNCKQLQSLDVSNWDIRKMSGLDMFNGCSSLQSLDVSNWDLTNITNISNLFNECSKLQSLDVSKWNTHNVTAMSNSFYNCSSLQTLDVSNWDVGNVTNMLRLFQYCSSLQSLDLRNWDVSKVTNMTFSFLGMPSLKTLIGGLTEEQVDITTVTCLNGLNISIDLSNTILDRVSLRALINGLADVNNLPAESRPTLTLGNTLLAKLTDGDKVIATEKGWNLA